ncbi:hypothetical protein Cgig2_006383 [Carnegiea gigantea]|uniref:Uncharacterized protein n=1 Tax=Carnegiea gigantea TaxID=171969 RepID=A0A9Q1K4L5_9CARY|nr:hypothetical protein Cgig2_006383 [Carnegiea gigantea]
MVLPGGVRRHGQRWAAGKGPTIAGRPPSDLLFSCFCPWCLFNSLTLRGTSLNRLRLTTPGTFHRLVADAGTNRMVGLGSVMADQRKLTSIPNEAPTALENNQQLASPYKQALLSYPNSNKLEAPNDNLEVAGNDVHESLSDNSKTITQSLDGAHNQSIFVGKFPSQALSYGSSMEDDEKINSSLFPFDNAFEMDIQLHEKRHMAKHSNKVQKMAGAEQLLPRPPTVPPVKSEELQLTKTSDAPKLLPMFRRGRVSRGQRIQLLTNHFPVKMPSSDGHFCHYCVKITYEWGHEVDVNGIERKVIDKVRETYDRELAGKELLTMKRRVYSHLDLFLTTSLNPLWC